MSYAQDQAARDAASRAARASTTEGVVTALDWAEQLVTVNAGGFTQEMRWTGPPPWVGDRVRLSTQAGLPVCWLIEGAPYGTVASVAGDYLNVLGDDAREYRYIFVAGTTYTGGERVALDHARKLVVGQLSIDPEFDEPPTPPKPPPSASRSAWFNPTWSGNWRSGSFAGDAAQVSSTRAAAYGYGGQIRDTIPDSATIRRAELHLVQTWDNVPGVASSMGVHGFGGRPGSLTNADLSGVHPVGGGSVVVDIRGPVIAVLVTGAALGVGFRSGSSGWREYAPAPASGRVYVEWS